MVNEPGHTYRINKVAIGYGDKMDYMKLKTAHEGPAPNHYEAHNKNSI